MQRIRKSVLDGPGPILPRLGLGEPVAPMGDVGPGADMGDPSGQHVDIAGVIVQTIDLAAHPLDRQSSVAIGQMRENLG